MLTFVVVHVPAGLTDVRLRVEGPGTSLVERGWRRDARVLDVALVARAVAKRYAVNETCVLEESHRNSVKEEERHADDTHDNNNTLSKEPERSGENTQDNINDAWSKEPATCRQRAKNSACNDDFMQHSN